jgi:wyosine [tRNA(Phe)-imidazoG37] synthetase (radical SAM superfamily)
LTNERRDYFPPEEIVSEVKDALTQLGPDKVDWLTFVGSGETTLHASLGWMIKQVKAASALPLAVITNGSLLHDPNVREELLPADLVMPSLDAGSEELYLRIDRPSPRLSFQSLVEGLSAFRKEYRKRLWIEVMLIDGVNDSDDALRDLADVLTRIGPDEVHLNIPVRPPTEHWVKPPSPDRLSRAQEILGKVASLIAPRNEAWELPDGDSVTDVVVSMIMRHPVTEKELLDALARWTHGEIADALRELQASGQIQHVLRGDDRFWSYSGARYIESQTSKNVSPTGRRGQSVDPK